MSSIAIGRARRRSHCLFNRVRFVVFFVICTVCSTRSMCFSHLKYHIFLLTLHSSSHRRHALWAALSLARLLALALVRRRRLVRPCTSSRTSRLSPFRTKSLSTLRRSLFRTFLLAALGRTMVRGSATRLDQQRQKKTPTFSLLFRRPVHGTEPWRVLEQGTTAIFLFSIDSLLTLLVLSLPSCSMAARSMPPATRSTSQR